MTEHDKDDSERRAEELATQASQLIASGGAEVLASFYAFDASLMADYRRHIKGCEKLHILLPIALWSVTN